MNRFEYRDEQHLYLLDGVIIPGVTQVLDNVGITDYSHIPENRRVASMHFGKAVHKACELYDKNDLDESKLSPMIIPYLEGWKKFLFDTDAKIIENEKPSYSSKYRYGFTIDRVLKIDGMIMIVDIKTSTDSQQGTDLQLAGYMLGYNEKKNRNEQADYRRAVHLNKDGGYNIEPYKNRNAVNEWLLCLSMYNLKKRRG